VTDRAPTYCIVPSAGTTGALWAAVRDQLDATVLPVPDELDVPTMAAALREEVERLPAPRVLIGASLGAMVALELARTVPVDALVLIAAGFGIRVGDALLDRVAAASPELLREVAKGSLADPENEAMVDAVTRDFEARGQPVLLGHLRALAGYTPEPFPEPPPTVVIWGEHDHSVALRAHAELALRCRGALVPLADAGHMPFFEQPTQTVKWIRAATRLTT
jgi:pimeloyl-ACP methyl ester carboxylesterase